MCLQPKTDGIVCGKLTFNDCINNHWGDNLWYRNRCFDCSPHQNYNLVVKNLPNNRFTLVPYYFKEGNQKQNK